MDNPVILGNSIRIWLETSEDYRTDAEIAASLPDLEPHISTLNALLREAHHTGDLAVRDLNGDSLDNTANPFVELQVEFRFDYYGRDSLLYFHNELFDHSARRLDEHHRIAMPRQNFIDAIHDDGWEP
jgi:hypothetical protein